MGGGGLLLSEQILWLWFLTLFFLGKTVFVSQNLFESSFQRSAQGSGALLAKPQEEGDQGFFSISSPTSTTEKINSSLENRSAKLDLAAPIVETVGGGRPHNFLSVTRFAFQFFLAGSYSKNKSYWITWTMKPLCQQYWFSFNMPGWRTGLKLKQEISLASRIDRINAILSLI